MSQRTPVAVVTGASRGLGAALTRGLVDRGWLVVATARRPWTAPTGAVTVIGDVTDPSHRARLARVAADVGGAGLLVNNASTLGASPLPTLADVPVDVLDDVLFTNVVAPLALTQVLLPQLLSASGRVLNISSDAAVEAYETWGAYGASKAALDHASRVLAVEQPTLRVFAVDPGDMRTQLHQDAYPGEDISDRPDPETVVPALLRLVEADLPSGRYRATALALEAVSA
ncbi:MAG TPA: SDR family NAD(P)-dependent oxidoreductase [Nocardioidaceae bacterium]|nr:SDR family NAD(P)-dependent oxidoreductase [Nocardioidaceae bacterium]